jgi:two-component sensor histidine kinase
MPGQGRVRVLSAAAETTAVFQRSYHGTADQVGRARREVVRHLDGCPVADDCALVVSELATNAVLHSQSRGESFTVRVRLQADHVMIECRDLGGPWRNRCADGHSHGLGIVEALAGSGNWGVEITDSGNRIVWARLDLPGAGTAAPPSDW